MVTQGEDVEEEGHRSSYVVISKDRFVNRERNGWIVVVSTVLNVLSALFFSGVCVSQKGHQLRQSKRVSYHGRSLLFLLLLIAKVGFSAGMDSTKPDELVITGCICFILFVNRCLLTPCTIYRLLLNQKICRMQ